MVWHNVACEVALAVDSNAIVVAVWVNKAGTPWVCAMELARRSYPKPHTFAFLFVITVVVIHIFTLLSALDILV